MSLFRPIERATSCRKHYEVASNSLFAFLCPALYDTQLQRRPGRRQHRPKDAVAASSSSPPSTIELENTFFNVLGRAGSCQNAQNSFKTSLLGTQIGAGARARSETQGEQRRSIHTKPARPVHEPPAAQTTTKEDLHSLVDIYEARLESASDPDTWDETPVSNESAAPGFEDGEKEWDDSYFTNNQQMNFAAPWLDAGRILDAMQDLLRHRNTPHEHLYALYKQLPGHRVNYMPSKTLNRLLAHLSHIPTSRFQPSYADDYLTLLYDMRSEQIPIDVRLWTTAIRYTGLARGPRDAVRLWREMEAHYEIAATAQTFSVLFDLACKSQHFALAEMIEKEARDRQVPLDRISRMSRIFYQGLLGDGAAVRKAYAQLVDAGEIVDTAVLTCVISSLINASEPDAAEETFARMKQLHAQKSGATLAPQGWRQRRDLRTLLTDAAHQYRDRPADRQRFQDAAPINPDWRTYRAFLDYHVRTTGSYPAIESLLTEMKRSAIPINREIYRVLFHGFAKHGGIQVVHWNARNLEVLWRSFERSCAKRPGEFAYDAKLCVAVVKAFLFVVGKARAREVWEVLKARWVVEGWLEGYMERLMERKKPWQGG